MVKTRTFPGWVLKASGAVVPFLRELQGVQYQFTGPWVIDSSATERELGVAPTPTPVSSSTGTPERRVVHSPERIGPTARGGTAG